MKTAKTGMCSLISIYLHSTLALTQRMSDNELEHQIAHLNISYNNKEIPQEWTSPVDGDSTHTIIQSSFNVPTITTVMCIISGGKMKKVQNQIDNCRPLNQYPICCGSMSFE